MNDVSTIYPDYSQLPPAPKKDMREILDQMIGVMVDFGDSYAKTQKTLNNPAYQDLKVQQRMGDKMNNWNNEIKNVMLNQRRNLNRLLTDIRYLVGSLPNSEKMYDELEKSALPLREHWDSTRMSPNSNKTKRQVDDVLKILDFPQSSQPAYINQPQTNPYIPVQRTTTPPTTSPRISQMNGGSPVQPVQKVYMIDPVTGQRIEKPDYNNRTTTPVKTTSTIVTTPSTAPSTSQTTYRRNPDGSLTAVNGAPNNQPTYVERIDIKVPPPNSTSGHHTPSTSNVATQQRILPTQPSPRLSQTPPPPVLYVPIAQAVQDNSTSYTVVNTDPNKTVTQTSQIQPINEYDYLSRRQDTENRNSNPDKVANVSNTFDAYREVKLEADDQPTKVEVSQDGQRVFYGGEAFGLLEYDTDGFLVPHGRIFSNRISDINPILWPNEIPLNQTQPSTIKGSQSGDVLVGEFNSWNVHLYDKEMQELGRLNSKAGSTNRLPTTYPHFKTTNKKPHSCLWYSGSQNLSVVDTKTYTNSEINNFWMMKGKPVDPLGVHLSKNGDIVGVARYEGYNNSLHLYNPKAPTTVLTFDRPDIFPYAKTWLCVDGSDAGDVFFIGGSSSPEQKGGSAFLIALSFDEYAEVLRYREFPPVSGFFAVQVLKTYPENVVMAAMHNALVVFLWNQGELISIKQINLTCPLYDFVLSTNNRYLNAPVVYAIMTNGTLTSFNFGKPQNGSRPITMKPVKRNNKVYEMGEYMSVAQPQQPLLPYDPLLAQDLTAEQRKKLRKALPQHAQLYKDFTVKQIMIQEGGLGRIEAMDNERMIYCGKKNLRVLENKNGEYVLQTRANNVKPFIDMVLVKSSGELIVVDRETSDLIKYDAGLNEVKRLKGIAPLDASVADFASTVYVGSEQRFLWIKGDNSLAVVDSITFNQEAIPNFFGKPGERSMPVAAISNKNFDKFVGLYNTDAGQQVVFLDRNVGLVRTTSTAINPKLPFMYSLENALVDQSVFFAGGSSSGNLQSSNAIIQAIRSSTQMELIDDLELKCTGNVPRQTVSWLTRANDRDVLFAGVNQAVFVVEWTGTHFCILNYVDEVHTAQPISVCSTNPTRIYTSSPYDTHLNRIDFRPA